MKSMIYANILSLIFSEIHVTTQLQWIIKNLLKIRSLDNAFPAAYEIPAIIPCQ